MGQPCLLVTSLHWFISNFTDFCWYLQVADRAKEGWTNWLMERQTQPFIEMLGASNDLKKSYFFHFILDMWFFSVVMYALKLSTHSYTKKCSCQMRNNLFKVGLTPKKSYKNLYSRRRKKNSFDNHFYFQLGQWWR